MADKEKEKERGKTQESEGKPGRWYFPNPLRVELKEEEIRNPPKRYYYPNESCQFRGEKRELGEELSSEKPNEIVSTHCYSKTENRVETPEEPFSEKQDGVVGTEEDIECLLNGERIKISCVRVYAELEHILQGMKAQETFIDLIEFVQDGNDKIMHAIYIGRYGLPSASGGKYFPQQGYWSLYGHGMSYGDKDYEIKHLRELIRQNGIKFRRVKVKNNALDAYSKNQGVFEIQFHPVGKTAPKPTS